eukprot:7318800-Pyramimonas_sp.AAC.1
MCQVRGRREWGEEERTRGAAESKRGPNTTGWLGNHQFLLYDVCSALQDAPKGTIEDRRGPL